MDFISIAVPSVTSILCIIISWILNNRNLTKKIWEIREEQLRKIYMPMELLLQSKCSAKEKVNSAQLIIKQNYALASPILLREVESLCKMTIIKDDDLIRLSKIVATHFEWTRKGLGYPFDPRRIERKLKPTYELRVRNGSYVFAILLSVWTICYGVLTFTILNKEPLPTVINNAFVVYVLLGLLAAVIYAICIILSHAWQAIMLAYSSLKSRRRTVKKRK